MPSFVSRLVALCCVSLLGSGCATRAHQTVKSQARLGVPPKAPAFAEVDDDDDDDETDHAVPQHASTLLNVGFEALGSHEAQAASAAFSQALATGELNEAGRALCYWHICACQMTLGHQDAGRDALADFILVAEDVMEQARRQSPRDLRNKDFIDRFELPTRLEQARALMSSAWAEKAHGFGRSPKTPVRVHSTSEMLAFLSMVPACQEPHDRRFLPGMRHSGGRPHPSQSAMNIDGHAVSRVDVACRDAQAQRISFYFEHIEDPAGEVAEDTAADKP